MKSMKKCCQCGRLVLPWQQSNVARSAIHIECHQKFIDNSIAKLHEQRSLIEELTFFKYENMKI